MTDDHQRPKIIPTSELLRLVDADRSVRVDHDRPRTRAQCENGHRPCPYVGCKHHLYLDVNPSSGSITINFPDRDVDEMIESCALDVADRGDPDITLEEIGRYVNLTRERIRQIEVRALSLMRPSMDEP